MNSKKRIATLTLALALTVGLGIPAMAAEDIRVADPYGGEATYTVLGVQGKEAAVDASAVTLDTDGSPLFTETFGTMIEPMIVKPGTVVNIEGACDARLLPLSLNGGKLADNRSGATEGSDYTVTMIRSGVDDPEAGFAAGSNVSVTKEGYYALYCLWPAPGYVVAINSILHVTSNPQSATGSNTPAQPAEPTEPVKTAETVMPSPCAVTLDGKPITLNAYLFTEGKGGSNYVMLRDVAMLLNQTKAQFDVTWDKTQGIIITTGKAYTPVGNELAGKGDGAKAYTANISAISIDGKAVELTAYTIEGNNYLKLRDLGVALGFGVDWNGTTGTVSIASGI